MSSTAFQSVTPIIPRILSVEYNAFPLDQDQLIQTGLQYRLTVEFDVIDQFTVVTNPAGINVTVPPSTTETATAMFNAGTIVEVHGYINPIEGHHVDAYYYDINNNIVEYHGYGELTFSVLMDHDITINFHTDHGG